MTQVGINGFGRIGKSLFIQILDVSDMHVCAINAPGFDMKYMETYLKNDSSHNYTIKHPFKVIDNDNFSIGQQTIHVFRNKNANELDWKSYGINHVIDATGAFLTTPKCQQHNVDYVVMSAPAKDDTPVFVYNVNSNNYAGEKIISNASCTTNCITPVLNFLNNKYKINNANFTTIHSTTASQTTVDIVNSNNRTHRSILNNIIPHSTGASKAIGAVIPDLHDKIFGTSLRVPVSNVSIVDLNVELEADVTLDDIINEFEKHEFIQTNNLNLVSCDFLTTTYPSIVDKNASMHLGGKRFKFMIWYDNEWSYSAQAIRMLQHMISYNSEKKDNINKYFIDNYNLSGKKVFLRVDWNIPTKDMEITDDYRITSSLPTIHKILKDNPEQLIIASHFGRPKGYTEKYSWKHYLSKIQGYFDEEIGFLEHGLSNKTIEQLKTKKHRIYLLENLRFHDEETNYSTYDINTNECIQSVQQLGDFYVNDAFGCMHRNHLSICGVKYPEKAFGYLVDKELQALHILLENKNNKKIMAICGGAKVQDKLPLLEELSKKVNTIYIAGGNVNDIIKKDMKEYITQIKQNKAIVHIMSDGYCANSITNNVNDRFHSTSVNLPNDKYFYDIGIQGLYDLAKLIDESDIIFWNGTLGVVENELYEGGSDALVNLLTRSNKQIIIGGGDTAGFVNKHNHNFHFVSTGGGACIEYISKGSLVGVDYFSK